MALHAPLDMMVVATPINPSREVIRSRCLVRLQKRKWESRAARIQFWVYALADGRKHHQHISKILSISEQEVRAAILELALQELVSFEVHEKMDKTLNAKLLHESFVKIKPYDTLFAEAFYRRLFEQYPAVRQLFLSRIGPDMRAQYEKLMASLAFVVMGVLHNDAIEKDLLALGARHVEYGAQEIHYKLVGRVLIETFQWCYQEKLKEPWTPELQQTWQQAIQLVAGIMQKATA